MTEPSDEIVAAGRETIAEVLELAREAVAAVVRRVELETGVTLSALASPSVMDATRAQIGDALLRARYAVAAAETVLGGHLGRVQDPRGADARPHLERRGARTDRGQLPSGGD
ncbi:hypothetical protein [Streptomyces sp. TP-A0356]|uniref:hypothetical protein n=1 Tax=Streptomyces sp. TP-A0356 TaxID=1359208 RepID=UPI000B2EFD09|nr:hypothetical protein [Streptomyces sp. TP-A0356]